MRFFRPDAFAGIGAFCGEIDDKLLFEIQLRICHLPLPMGEVPPKGAERAS